MDYNKTIRNQNTPPSLEQHFNRINNLTFNSTSMHKHLFSHTNTISVLLNSKKHMDDFQARKNDADNPSPSPRKKARVDNQELE